MKKRFALLSASLLFASLTYAAPEQPLSKQQVVELNRTIHLIEKNYIKRVNEQTLMDNAMTGMLSKLDPHSAYLNEGDMNDLESSISGQFVGIGVELTTEHGLLKVITPINGAPAAKAGLEPGDLIVKINRNFVQDMSVNDAIRQIKGKAGTKVALTILRKNLKKPLVLTITRAVVHIQAVQSKLLAPGYGYVRITMFQGPVANKVKKAILALKKESGGHLKGFVLDLRNNPGGLLDASAEVLDLFLNNKETARYHHLAVYTKGRMPDADLKYYLHNESVLANTPMITLINGGTASASEIVAGALQDYKRATIVGTRSFGKGSVQTLLPVGPHSAIKLTTALYYTPRGREIQARGIAPDVIVPYLSMNAANENPLDEAAFVNHLINHSNKTKKSAETQRLAYEDYPLYEALVLLKAKQAMR